MSTDDVRLDSLEEDADEVDFSETVPLIVNISKRRHSDQDIGHNLKVKISDQQHPSNNNNNLSSPFPAPVSDLSLKPRKISSRFATHGSKVQSELVVGLDLAGNFEIKKEDEAVDVEKEDFKHSFSTEKVKHFKICSTRQSQ